MPAENRGICASPEILDCTKGMVDLSLNQTKVIPIFSLAIENHPWSHTTCERMDESGAQRLGCSSHRDEAQARPQGQPEGLKRGHKRDSIKFL